MVKITRDPRYSSDSLQHFGILGMKWGVRRYQNEDGTYTEKGKQRENLDNNGNKNVLTKNSSKNSKNKVVKVLMGTAAIAATVTIGAKVVKDILNKADSKRADSLSDTLISSLGNYDGHYDFGINKDDIKVTSFRLS